MSGEKGPISTTVEKGTGLKPKTLAWLAVGAAVGAALVAPLLRNWLGLSMEIALIVGGFAVAMIFKSGAAHTMGAGSAIFGLALLAVAWIGPYLSQLPFFGGASQKNSGPARGPSTAGASPSTFRAALGMS